MLNRKKNLVLVLVAIVLGALVFFLLRDGSGSQSKKETSFAHQDPPKSDRPVVRTPPSSTATPPDAFVEASSAPRPSRVPTRANRLRALDAPVPHVPDRVREYMSQAPHPWLSRPGTPSAMMAVPLDRVDETISLNFIMVFLDVERDGFYAAPCGVYALDGGDLHFSACDTSGPDGMCASNGIQIPRETQKYEVFVYWRGQVTTDDMQVSPDMQSKGGQMLSPGNLETCRELHQIMCQDSDLSGRVPGC